MGRTGDLPWCLRLAGQARRRGSCLRGMVGSPPAWGCQVLQKPRLPEPVPSQDPGWDRERLGQGKGPLSLYPQVGCVAKPIHIEGDRDARTCHLPIGSLCAHRVSFPLSLFLINASEQAVFIFRGPHTQVQVEEFSRRFRFFPPGGPARSMEALGLRPCPRPLPLQVTTLSLPQTPGGKGRASRGHSSMARHLCPQELTQFVCLFKLVSAKAPKEEVRASRQGRHGGASETCMQVGAPASGEVRS